MFKKPDNLCSQRGTTIKSQDNNGSSTFSQHIPHTPSPIVILKRSEKSDYNHELNSNKNYPLLRPLLPYHKRWKNYLEKREEIFNVSFIEKPTNSKPKRSTLRMRKYWKLRKCCRKFLVSAIMNNPRDGRYYARVSFLDFSELGLIDTGANISCIGSELADFDFSRLSSFTKCKSFVKTADGRQQLVVGWVDTDITFKHKTQRMKLFVIPSISQRLILGLDFCKSFQLLPNIIESVDIIAKNYSSDRLNDISTFDNVSSRSCELVTDSNSNEEFYKLTPDQRNQLDMVINLFPNFAKQGLGRTNLIKHHIDVGDSTPIKQRFYPVSPAVEKLMFQEIDRMLSLGVIETSSSPWSSPMRLVVKPNKIRLCLDARRVNQVTKKDAYPLPSIEGIFARLPKANIITKLDLKDAYWQIALDDASKPLTAFTVPGRPLYQFVVMPFGLCNAPQTMCRLMDDIIPFDLRNCVFGYLDDLVIVSEDFESHLEVLVRISSQFKKANLTLNIAKSKFCVTRVNYLGYVIGDGGITTDPEKVSAIQNWPVPRNLKQVRGFLGLAGWYRRFIGNFSSIVFDITEVLSSKRKFIWTPEAQSAFENIKTLLTTAPILANPDFSKKFYVHCDASDVGIGAVLVQHDDEGGERPIAYMSRKLNTAQRNYSVTERECLAAIEAIKKFRCYIEMQEFEVVTDHSSLVWLMRQPNLSGRLARWVLKLQGLKFNVSHRKGKDHVVPDALSRISEGEIYAAELIEPEINLDSEYFDSMEYSSLRERIREDESKYPDIKIVDKYVYIRTEHYTGDESQENQSWKLWIPKQLQTQVISRAHDNPVAAHGGTHKTLELIRRNFYWPGMVRDVRQYVQGCEVCKTTKATNIVTKPPMGKQLTSVRPFQRLYIDILGPYPRSKSGFIGLLIVLDHLTKYHWLCPLRKFTASVIETFLEQQIFHAYGVPEVIVSDNGSQFKSNDFNAFLTKYGITHTYTAYYSPQSNASERVNRSLIAGIRAYIKQDHRLWDERLSFISCALRNSYHQTIGCSPYYAMFGFNMITHGTTYRLLQKLHLLDEPCTTLDRADQLQTLRQDIRKHIKTAYEKNQAQYNLRTRIPKYNVGQVVYRRNFAQSNQEKKFNAKLSPVFLKAIIREKLGSHYYILEDEHGKLIGTFHGKDIRS